MGVRMQPQCRTFVKPYTHALTEPAHTLYVNGVYQPVVFSYFASIYAVGQHAIHEAVHQFLESWTWPYSVGKAQLL